MDQEVLIGNHRRIIFHQNHLRMSCFPGANLFIGGIPGMSSGISHGGPHYPFDLVEG
jgi:hypothetical protein